MAAVRKSEITNIHSSEQVSQEPLAVGSRLTDREPDLHLQLHVDSHTALLLACLDPGHIYMSSLVDRWHCGILGGQLEIFILISLMWQLFEPNGQQ